VAPLLDQIDGLVDRVTADGAYDGAPTYETIAAHGDDIEVVMPPRSTAMLSGEQGPLAQRDRHLEILTERGRLAWQKATDYGKRIPLARRRLRGTNGGSHVLASMLLIMAIGRDGRRSVPRTQLN
jgi:hypothetical protein